MSPGGRFAPLLPVNYATDHRRLFLQTEVRWLSRGNCLKRFMELFESLSEFFKDKSDMILLMTTYGKAYVSYLADIFEKVCSLNKQFQKANATRCDANAKIYGFVTFLSFCRNNILSKSYVQFSWLKLKNVITLNRQIQLLLHTWKCWLMTSMKGFMTWKQWCSILGWLNHFY